MGQRILAIGAELAAGALAGCGADSDEPAERAAKLGTPTPTVTAELTTPPGPPKTREHGGLVVVRVNGPHSEPLP